MLWQKRSRLAAELIGKESETKPLNITFTRTEDTEQITN